MTNIPSIARTAPWSGRAMPEPGRVALGAERDGRVSRAVFAFDHMVSAAGPVTRIARR